jgi:hypothetical protein
MAQRFFLRWYDHNEPNTLYKVYGGVKGWSKFRDNEWYKTNCAEKLPQWPGPFFHQHHIAGNGYIHVRPLNSLSTPLNLPELSEEAVRAMPEDHWFIVRYEDQSPESWRPPAIVPPWDHLNDEIEVEGPDLILGNQYYLKHAQSQRYLTAMSNNAPALFQPFSQYYPTLGAGNAVKIMITGDSKSRTVGQMTELQISTPTEWATYMGTRYDVLMAWSGEYPYWYYSGYSSEYQTWIIFTRGSKIFVDGTGGPVKCGVSVNLINKGYSQSKGASLLAASLTENLPNGWLVRVNEFSRNCNWIFEEAK